jgi:transcriptional regulator with XRE-family HTH domain
MTIHQRVRALREGLGLTQEAFATRTGQTRTNINHVENGRRGLAHHAVLSRMAEGIRVPTEVLVGYLGGEVSLAVVLRMAGVQTPSSGEAA